MIEGEGLTPELSRETLSSLPDQTRLCLTRVSPRFDVIDSSLPNSEGRTLKMCLLVKTSLGRIRRSVTW